MSETPMAEMLTCMCFSYYHVTGGIAGQIRRVEVTWRATAIVRSQEAIVEDEERKNDLW